MGGGRGDLGCPPHLPPGDQGVGREGVGVTWAAPPTHPQVIRGVGREGVGVTWAVPPHPPPGDQGVGGGEG